MSILSKLREFFNRPTVSDPWTKEALMVHVRKGDTLSALAKRHLGDAARWPEIYAQNKHVIGPNPDKIYPGTVLLLPRKDKP